MKRIIILLVVFYGCSQKHTDFGSLSGNVFWKYNDYVGNKPDAGSSVEVFSLNDSTLSFETKADIRGDFKFDSIPAGDYLIMVRSKNTTDDSYSIFNHLHTYSLELSKIFGSDILKFVNYKNYDTLAKIFDSTARILKPGDFGSNSKYEKMKERLRKLAQNIIDSLPNNFKVRTLIIGTGSKKVKFEKVSIAKGRPGNVVVDFGITYY